MLVCWVVEVTTFYLLFSGYVTTPSNETMFSIHHQQTQFIAFTLVLRKRKNQFGLRFNIPADVAANGKPPKPTDQFLILYFFKCYRSCVYCCLLLFNKITIVFVPNNLVMSHNLFVGVLRGYSYQTVQQVAVFSVCAIQQMACPTSSSLTHKRQHWSDDVEFELYFKIIHN